MYCIEKVIWNGYVSGRRETRYWTVQSNGGILTRCITGNCDPLHMEITEDREPDVEPIPPEGCIYGDTVHIGYSIGIKLYLNTTEIIVLGKIGEIYLNMLIVFHLSQTLTDTISMKVYLLSIG